MKLISRSLCVIPQRGSPFFPFRKRSKSSFPGSDKIRLIHSLLFLKPTPRQTRAFQLARCHDCVETGIKCANGDS